MRQSIQDDFSRPIANAVKPPIAGFNQMTYYARDVMRQVGEDVRFRSRTSRRILIDWIRVWRNSGYYFFAQATNRIGDRLEGIQKQITPAAPIPETKTIDGKTGRGKKEH